jgi:hypothetical protein
MGKRSMIQILRTDLAEHPATVAWCELRAVCVVPEEIAILKRRNDSKVYRLAGIGPRGANVIAKYCHLTSALAERMIYRELLPHVPFGHPEYYGLCEEAGDDFCWVFVEDAAGVSYCPEIYEHRVLAAQWLGLLHTTAAEAARKLDLRDCGPGHYLTSLRVGRERISRSLPNPALNGEQAAILEPILAQCEFLETRWSRVEELCNGMPRTFVHADLHNKNLHIGPNGQGVVLAFDWESAGWGTPAIDLALTGLHIPTYWSVVRETWLGLNLNAVERSALAGRIFQLLELIDWESRALTSEWPQRAIEHMRWYHAEIADALHANPLDG